jgi:hypothetical protein
MDSGAGAFRPREQHPTQARIANRRCDIRQFSARRRWRGRSSQHELRHAELAWRFARWAVERGGEAVWLVIERAVRQAIAETRRIPMRDYGVDDAAWSAHGRLTCVQAHRPHERAITEVVEPGLSAPASIAVQVRPFSLVGRLPWVHQALG